MKKAKENTLQDAIVELYLSVKIRKQEEIENYDEVSQDKEKEKLRKANPFTIIEYIKSSIEILIDLKVQEQLQERELASRNTFSYDEDVNEYEKLLRKLEGDIRSYIKIEHQMKIHSENLQQRVEELEKQKEELKMKNKLLQEQLARSGTNPDEEEEMKNYKNEISHLQQLVKTYEEHNLKIPELEKKLRNQRVKFEKEMKNMESFYKEKIKTFSKKLEQYEDVLKNNGGNNPGNNPGINNTKNNSSNLSNPSNFRNLNNKTRSKSKLNKSNDEDIDRVNYNYIPSRNHSPDIKNNYSSNTSRREKSGDKKKEVEYISNKIEQYKKGIDKKINENIKTIIDDLKRDSSRERSMKTVATKDISKDSRKESNSRVNANQNKITLESNNNTMDLSKNKTNPDLSDVVSYPKTHRKHESSGMSLKNMAMISNYKSRGSSQDKSRIPNNKTIHAMKDGIKAPSHIPKESHTPGSQNNSNIILNQNGLPCFNNIHIYTSGINGIKTGDINLRQYIFSKAGKKNKMRNNSSLSGLNANIKNDKNNKSALHARSNSVVEGH